MGREANYALYSIQINFKMIHNCTRLRLSSQDLLPFESGSEIIGLAIERVDARMKVTGRAVYTRDMRVPNMLYGRIKRCPYPHARILGIRFSQALTIASVRAIITGRDFPLRPEEDTPALAYDEVLYANQGVVAVAAETPEAAELAMDAIEVDYEELPGVFDPERAMLDAPAIVVHQGGSGEEPNVGRHLKLRTGDVEKGFLAADFVIENKYTTSPESHFQMEPLSFLAQPEPNGGVTIWCTSSGAHRMRVELARYLDIDPYLVRVMIPLLGGHFGPKDEGPIAAVCAMLALKSRCTVKLDLSREESITATAVRSASSIGIRDGVTKDGRIIVREIKAIHNGGAYGSHGNYVINRSLIAASTVYDIPNMKIDAYNVYTNFLPSNPKRGPVGTQMIWAIESQMEHLASLLDINPVEFRLKNILHEGDTNSLGEKMESVSPEKCLWEVARRIGLGEKQPPSGPWVNGKGVALASKWTAGGIAEATVQVTETGKILVSVDLVENGQGIYTGITQLVAAEFGTNPSEVILLPFANFSDSAVSGLATGATASRQMTIAGSAVILACRDVKTRIAKLAGKKLGRPPLEIDIKGTKIFSKSDPDRSIDVSELFTNVPLEVGPGSNSAFVEDGSLVGHGTMYKKMGHLDPETGRAVGGRVSPYYVTVAQAAEVSVNVETGQVKVHRIAAAMDVGRAINPTLVKGQIVGSVAMGLNAALSEALVFSEGRITNANLADYKLLSATDAPTIEPIIVETPHHSGPYGAKSAGEPSILPTAAAVRNAIHDAIGLWINDMPMTQERILETIERGNRR